MEIIEYSKLPSFDADLKYIVYYGNQEYHVVLKSDSNKTLKETLQEALKLDEFELKARRK